VISETPRAAELSRRQSLTTQFRLSMLRVVYCGPAHSGRYLLTVHRENAPPRSRRTTACRQNLWRTKSPDCQVECKGRLNGSGELRWQTSLV